VTNPGCVSNWTALFNWGAASLYPPKRGGKHQNLSSTIKATASPRELCEPGQVKRPQMSDDLNLSHAMTTKLEDGNVRAAFDV